MPSFLKISTLNSSFVKFRKRSRPAHETQPLEFPLGKLRLATTVSSSATSICCCCCCCSGCRSCGLILGGLWCRKWWRCISRSKSDCCSLLSSWAKTEGSKKIVAASNTRDNHNLGSSILKTCLWVRLCFQRDVFFCASSWLKFFWFWSQDLFLFQSSLEVFTSRNAWKRGMGWLIYSSWITSSNWKGTSKKGL